MGGGTLTDRELLIDGRWTGAQDGATETVASPIDGLPVARVAAAAPADVELAVAAAGAAYERHRWRTAFTRAQELHAVADAIEARRDELAAAIVAEAGKPLAEARGEALSAASHFRLAAEEATRVNGETIPVADPRKRVLTWRMPKGVYAIVTAFNFPAGIPAEYIAPALAGGNAVILKPAPTTPGVAAILAECVQQGGVPDGLFNLLTGSSVEMAEALTSHPGVVGVGFTGSTAVGERVARSAAGKELVLELGGNGPLIVLADADLDAAARAVAASSFGNAGQVCTGVGHVLAATAVHDELVAAVAGHAGALVLGDPRDEATTLGPLNHAGVADNVEAHVADARERGAQVAAGGARAADRPTPLYFEATVLADVPEQALVLREETFGPVAPIARMKTDAELVAAARRTGFGLSSAVFTRDLERAFWFAERLDTGQVTINDTTKYGERHLPFGGWAGTRSGTGRLGARYAIETFTQLRTVAFDIGSEENPT
jgi:acyl-CoA reductase-like NAD-dependent aldehyde dehydrogenase